MSLGEILGLTAGTAGFALAIWQILIVKAQIKKAVTVAEATQQAVGDTERLNALIELIRVIPQMQRLERDVTLAIKTGKKDTITSHLQNWRGLAAEMRGLIQEQDFESSSLESRLHESSNSAAQAIERLDGAEDVTAATKFVLTAIAATTEDASVLMGRLKARPGVQKVNVK
jgi:hypothetical protein